jgi:hypothetical protein
MSCLKKQLFINHLPLPTDITEYIKEFCFQDIITRTKEQKKNVVKNIKKCAMRKIPSNYDNFIKCEVFIYIETMQKYKFVKTFICTDCGQVKKSYNFERPAKIICLCP